MDAKYLSDNVNFALTEALASMAVSLPDDGVEYVGKYLLQFVDRKNMLDKVSQLNTSYKKYQFRFPQLGLYK